MKQIYVAFKNWTGGHNLIASLCFYGLGGAWHGICNVSGEYFKEKMMSEKQQGLIDDLNDLQAFCESLKPGEVVVISGGAGVGKTTLAMRMAIALVSSLADMS